MSFVSRLEGVLEGAILASKVLKESQVEKQHPRDACGMITNATRSSRTSCPRGDLSSACDVCDKPVRTVPVEMDVKHVA